MGPINGGEVLVYQAEDGSALVEVRLERDTVWLTQAQMAELFGRERSVITKHVRNVFREGELAEESNVQNLHILPPTGRLLRIHKGCIRPRPAGFSQTTSEID